MGRFIGHVGRRRGTAGPRFPKWTLVPSFIANVDSGEDFWIGYLDGDASSQTLNRGKGWKGGWQLNESYLTSGADDMESYSDQDPVAATLDGGSNWADPWMIEDYS